MILKQLLQQRLKTFHTSGWTQKIKMDTENENQLKRIRKPPLLLGQEKSLAEKVKKYPCLLITAVFQKFSLPNTFAIFSRFDYSYWKF